MRKNDLKSTRDEFSLLFMHLNSKNGRSFFQWIINLLLGDINFVIDYIDEIIVKHNRSGLENIHIIYRLFLVHLIGYG